MRQTPQLSILVVSPVAEDGGAENLLIDVLAGLQERGAKVALIALGQGPLKDLAGLRGVPFSSGPGLSLRQPSSIFHCAEAIRRSVYATQPDLILASHPKGQIIARLACHGDRARAHATQLYDPPAGSGLSTRIAALVPGLRLAITEETAAAYHALNKRLHPIVIPPGVDRERIRKDAAQGDGNAAWAGAGLGGDGPRIVMVGRLQRFKGCFDFLSTAALVVQERPDARFLIIGPDSPIEPDLRKELMMTVHADGLSTSVAVTGRLSRADLAATVREATVLVHPAHREPFGLAVVEALSLGTPVVAYETSGPRAILAYGAGSLVTPHDIPALATAVLQAIRDPLTLRRWAAEAENVSHKFDISASISQYWDVLSAASLHRERSVTMIGVHPPPPCGVHDYGRSLAAELQGRGFSVKERWLLNPGDRAFGALLVSMRLLRLAVNVPRHTKVIWHYSPVVYGYRGVPLWGVFLGFILRLRGADVISVLHELAYTYRPGIDRPRTRIMALAQQLALRAVLTGSSDVVVTTQRRQAALKRWGGHQRRIHAVPVFSTIPCNGLRRTNDPGPPFVIGVPAYAGDGVRPDLLTRALRKLGPPGACRVVLLGAPGADSADGQRWLRQAAEQGVQESLQFTGLVTPAEFSQHLIDCDVVVLVNEEGPSSRKTSLATALAHGLPVVSLDGYNRWEELIAAGAVRVVPNSAATLAGALVRLRNSPAERAALAAAAASFAATHMSLTTVADAFVDMLAGSGPGAADD